MKNFNITIQVPFYNPKARKFETKEMEGEFQANTKRKAINECKEWYSSELGTIEEEIKIINVTEM